MNFGWGSGTLTVVDRQEIKAARHDPAACSMSQQDSRQATWLAHGLATFQQSEVSAQYNPRACHGVEGLTRVRGEAVLRADLVANRRLFLMTKKFRYLAKHAV